MPVFEAALGQAVVALPMVLLLLVGLILIATRGARLAGRAKALAAAGCAVLVLVTLAKTVWGIAIPSLLRSGAIATSSFGSISIGVGVLLNLMEALGLGLLIGAVVSGRTQPAPATAHQPSSAPLQPATPGQTPWGPPPQG